jgi:spore coat protein A, manganese oxidase
MKITRRSLLGAGAAASAGMFLPLRLPVAANAAVPMGVTPFTETLPTLADLGVIDATGGGRATIQMVNATHRFHRSLPKTPTFAYRSRDGGQDYLGPVIVARQNVPFSLTVVNRLGAHPLASAIDDALVPAGSTDGFGPRTALHLHGGNTDPANDGDPMDTFTRGGSKTYEYQNTQEAAGLWYHDHAMGITRLNVFAGLAGGYLIRNGDDPGNGRLRRDGSGLPGAPYEVPLIIQDRRFNPDGTFDYPRNENPTTDRAWSPEFFGDVATVNGKAWPTLTVRRGKYRFRVYNGSNARFYNLALASGDATLTFFQIGTDGGLLDAPVPLRTLLLAPGERADLVVDFSGQAPGAKIVLTNDAVVPFPAGDPDDVPLRQIMQFTVAFARGWTAPLPRRLRATPITRLAGRQVAASQDMVMCEILDAAGAPLMALMNNRGFHSDEMPMTVKSDTLEQWNLINTTGDAHPMHLHFTQFQVLNRQRFDADGYLAATYGDFYKDGLMQPNTGPCPPPPVDDRHLTLGSAVPPAANELGWKDTVVCPPGEITRILVPFGAKAVRGKPMAIGASHTGDYVSHCHILEHEDNDMMMRYTIEG